MIIFTQPAQVHVPALQRFKDAFVREPLHGACGLSRYHDAQEWVDERVWLIEGNACYILYDTELDTVLAIARFTKRPGKEMCLGRGYNFGYSVHPDYRHRGYGLQILNSCADVAYSSGLKHMLMAASVDNVSSWKCMEAAGAGRISLVHSTYIYKLDVSHRGMKL